MGLVERLQVLVVGVGQLDARLVDVDVQPGLGRHRVPARPRRQRHDRQRLALLVERKVIQLRVRRDLVPILSGALRAGGHAGVAGAVRGGQLVEHHPVVVAMGGQVDVPVLAEVCQREQAVRPFEPAAELRRAQRASRGHRRRQEARDRAHRRGHAGQPAQLEPLRVQPRVERRPSKVQAARHRRIAEIHLHGGRRVQRAAVRRRQPGIELRLVVGVARLDLRVADRHLVQVDVARLRVEEHARRADRPVDGEVGVQVALERALRVVVALRLKSQPLHHEGSDHRAQLDRRVREPRRRM